LKKILALDIKYALMQVLYFGSFCGLMAYASVFFLAHGVSNATIGIILAITSVITVFTQPLIADFADQHPQIELRKLVVVMTVLTIILSILLYVFKGITALLIAFFVSVATIMMTMQPLFNSLAFVFEKYGIEINYGVARGLGSASYALVSFAVGHLVEAYNADLIPLVYIILNILLVLVVYGFVLPKTAKTTTTLQAEKQIGEKTSFIQFCTKYKRFMIFVFGVMVVFFTHTIINNFFIQILTPINGTEGDMGTAVFIAAIVELPAMSMFNVIRQKISCQKLLMISVVVFALKHTLTYLATSVFMIYVAQFMQIGAYAILIPASVYYVNDKIAENDANKGQSMVTTAIAASGILANLVGGILLDTLGVHQVLLIGAIVSFIGAAIVIVAMREPKQVHNG